MNEVAAITFRLETFLVQLDDMHGRWTQWLGNMETALIQVDADRLTKISESASGLMDDLQGILDDRERLLADALSQGIPAADVSTLASRLPAWQKPGFRSAISAARGQIRHLKRLHYATWVLIHQTLEHTGDVMRLMARGTLRQDVYMPPQNPDSEGGQLLDTSS